MRPNRPRIVVWTITLGLAALLTAGCAGAPASPMPQAPAPQAPAPDGSYPESMPNEGGGATLSTDRKIARTASITLVVDDIRTAADALSELATRFDGVITNESLSLPDANGRTSGYSSVQVTVASENLDEALNQIANLGRVTSREIKSVDVTEQVVDVDARVKTMQESIARLQELMQKAGSIAEIANVESELTTRQASLEALLATQKSLNNRVATAPISVQLRTESQAPAAVNGFLPGLQAGWGSMTTAGQFALTALGALLPWLVLAAIVVVPLMIWRRNRMAARQAPKTRERMARLNDLLGAAPPAYPVPEPPAPAEVRATAPSVNPETPN